MSETNRARKKKRRVARIPKRFLLDDRIDAIARARSKRLMSTPECATFLGVSPTWLKTRRTCGGGPPYDKIGHSVRYDRKAIVAWLAKRRNAKVAVSAAWLAVFIVGRARFALCSSTMSFSVVEERGDRVAFNCHWSTRHESHVRRGVTFKRHEVEEAAAWVMTALINDYAVTTHYCGRQSSRGRVYSLKDGVRKTNWRQEEQRRRKGWHRDLAGRSPQMKSLPHDEAARTDCHHLVNLDDDVNVI
jgi:predicted DNA-binding transcriptional regulator AlpA